MTDTRRELHRGLGWFGSATLVTRGIDLLSTVVVLNFLSKEAFGLASLAGGTTVILETLSGLGVAGAIVQMESLEERAKSSLFWWCIATSLVLAALVFLGAGYIASFYGSPELEPMIALSGVKFFFVGAAIVPLQMLTREMRFREVSLVQTGASFGEALTKIVLAFLGFGAWALVWANVLRGLFLFVGLMPVTRFRPALHFRRAEIAPYVGYGVRISGAGLVTELYRNLDYFLVGRFLGVATLGVYRVAFDLAMIPAEAIAQPIYRVTFPLFSRVARDKEQLIDAFLRSSRYLLMFTSPVALLVSFAGADALQVLSADKWLGAAPALGLLCWAAVMRTSTRLFSNIFNATGRPGLALLDSVLTLLVLGGLMTSFLHFFAERLGVLAVCYAWLAAYPILFFVFWRLCQLVVPLPFMRYAKEHLPVLGVLALAAVAAWLVDATLSERLRQIHPLLSLLAVALPTLAVYIGLLRGAFRERKANLDRPA